MSGYVDGAKAAGESIGQGISGAADSVKSAVSSTMNDFSSSNVMNASNEFLSANGIIAKFMFIVLVLIVFMFLLNVGMALVYYFASPTTTPYLVHGMRSGTAEKIVSQDPASSKQVVYRSNNQSNGIEFTWATWLKFDAVPASSSTYKCLFVKGASTGFKTDGTSSVNNGPGLYANQSPDASGIYCNIRFIMDTVSPSNASQTNSVTLDMSNVPLFKWVHVAYRLQNKILDCYINGVLTQRQSFNDMIPKQNYDNIIVCGNQGFPGSISNLRYYDYALSVFELNSVVYYGPNLNADSDGNEATSTSYLSQYWYANKVAPYSR
jgi:Concanavalin A-like lectin/glucanases superfamily